MIWRGAGGKRRRGEPCVLSKEHSFPIASGEPLKRQNETAAEESALEPGVLLSHLLSVGRWANDKTLGAFIS